MKEKYVYRLQKREQDFGSNPMWMGSTDILIWELYFDKINTAKKFAQKEVSEHYYQRSINLIWNTDDDENDEHTRDFGGTHCYYIKKIKLSNKVSVLTAKTHLAYLKILTSSYQNIYRQPSPENGLTGACVLSVMYPKC